LHIHSPENRYISHHLQGAGAYCGNPNAGCTACYRTDDRMAPRQYFQDQDQDLETWMDGWIWICCC